MPVTRLAGTSSSSDLFSAPNTSNHGYGTQWTLRPPQGPPVPYPPYPSTPQGLTQEEIDHDLEIMRSWAEQGTAEVESSEPLLQPPTPPPPPSPGCPPPPTSPPPPPPPLPSPQILPEPPASPPPPVPEDASTKKRKRRGRPPKKVAPGVPKPAANLTDPAGVVARAGPSESELNQDNSPSSERLREANTKSRKRAPKGTPIEEPAGVVAGVVTSETAEPKPASPEANSPPSKKRKQPPEADTKSRKRAPTSKRSTIVGEPSSAPTTFTESERNQNLQTAVSAATAQVPSIPKAPPPPPTPRAAQTPTSPKTREAPDDSASEPCKRSGAGRVLVPASKGPGKKRKRTAAHPPTSRRS